MKLVKTYVADSNVPSNAEIADCIDIATTEDCIVRLEWFFPYSGKHSADITYEMSLEEVKSKISKRYSV